MLRSGIHGPGKKVEWVEKRGLVTKASESRRSLYCSARIARVLQIGSAFVFRLEFQISYNIICIVYNATFIVKFTSEVKCSDS